MSAPTMTTAELLALLDYDPAAGILATADLREQRAKAATPGPYRSQLRMVLTGMGGSTGGVEVTRVLFGEIDAEHIAAEANPAHALAAVRRWRGVVERHRPTSPEIWTCRRCVLGMRIIPWPCADLTETADEARAYLGA